MDSYPLILSIIIYVSNVSGHYTPQTLSFPTSLKSPPLDHITQLMPSTLLPSKYISLSFTNNKHLCNKYLTPCSSFFNILIHCFSLLLARARARARDSPLEIYNLLLFFSFLSFIVRICFSLIGGF